MSITLKELRIKNLKNVNSGDIHFTDKKGMIHVLGIYGQNGSGKTTVVDAIEIIQHLILGNSIPDHSQGIFNTEPGIIDPEQLPSIFIEIEDEENLTLRYEVMFVASKEITEQTVNVAHETISYKGTGSKERFKHLYSFSILNTPSDATQVTGELKSRTKIISNDAIEFLTNSSLRTHSSYLFSTDFTKLIERADDGNIEKKVLNIFKQFGNNIRIYTQQAANLTGIGTMPININYKDDSQNIKGILPVILNKGGTLVPKEIVPAYENTVHYMNEIIPTIIPNLSIEMKISDSTINPDGSTSETIHFFANRNGKVFSLIHESEGVKKIISMIGVLIEVYNNPNILAVIDELDSSIFEYLLGELIEVFSKDAQGQLIFTSHNLRVLELLTPRQIRFSTTNPDNRYISLKGVKSTNNLRDVYLRSLLVGGAEEELYQGKSQAKIRRSLRKAGKKIGN